MKMHQICLNEENSGFNFFCVSENPIVGTVLIRHNFDAIINVLFLRMNFISISYFTALPIHILLYNFRNGKRIFIKGRSKDSRYNCTLTTQGDLSKAFPSIQDRIVLLLLGEIYQRLFRVFKIRLYDYYARRFIEGR